MHDIILAPRDCEAWMQAAKRALSTHLLLDRMAASDRVRRLTRHGPGIDVA